MSTGARLPSHQREQSPFMTPTKQSTKKTAAKRPQDRGARSRGTAGEAHGTPRKTSSLPRTGKPLSDAIAVLKQDHRRRAAVQALREGGRVCARTRGTRRVDDRSALRRGDRGARVLSAVWQEIPRLAPEGGRIAEEHHLARACELRVSTKSKRYDAKVTVMMEVVRHHVKEEERDLSHCPRDQRRASLELVRPAPPQVPTRPHPGARRASGKPLR